MLAAGLELPSTSPTQKWLAAWNHILDQNNRQTLLPEDPWIGNQVDVPHDRRLVPRPDWAPRMPLPTDTTHLYIAGSASGGWAICAARGGNGLRDNNAAHLLDSAGPLQLGGDEDELRATIIAAQAALEITLSDLAGTSPLLLRVDERYSRHLAGMVPPPQNCENLAKEFRCLLLHIRQSRQVWMAGWRRGRLYWWGDRAAALAPQCTTGSLGPQPPTWLAAPPIANLAGGDAATNQCPVCLDNFTDPLPLPRAIPGHNRTRSSDVFHGCPQPHAACVQCDKQLALHPQPKCTMCRRPREPWASLLP